MERQGALSHRRVPSCDAAALSGQSGTLRTGRVHELLPLVTLGVCGVCAVTAAAAERHQAASWGTGCWFKAPKPGTCHLWATGANYSFYSGRTE